MKMLSSLASIAGVLALVVSAPGQAAPPAKSPSAQIHTVTTDNMCAADGSQTMLNNALANGNPNAVIVASFNTTPYTGGPSFFTDGLITIFYDADGTACGSNGIAGRWQLNVESATAEDLTVGQRFNIIVMNPTQ